MLQNFSDMQIIGLIILATIIFIFIRRTYRNYRISKAIKVCHGPVQQLEELANSNDPVEIAELPKKAIIVTILTVRIIVEIIRVKDRKHYERIVISTNRMVATWLSAYPTYNGIDIDQILHDLNCAKFPLTDFSEHILFDKLDQANALIETQASDEELQVILREFVVAFKG